MHKKLRPFFLFGSFLISASNLFGQDNQISVGAPFLTITPDARAAGYGDQGAATSPDNNSQYWNPAKYAFANGKYGGSYSFTPWLKNITDDISLHYLSGYYKVDDKQTVSASLRYFSLGNITFTGNDGNITTDFKPNEFSIDVAYSRKLAESLSASIAFRYLRSDLTGNNAIPDLNIDTKAASAFAADIALYYQKVVGQNEYALGVNISNIGPKVSYSNVGEKSFIPTNLRVGVRYTRCVGEKSKVSGLLETSKLLVPTPDIENGVDKNANKGVLDGIFSSFGDAPGGFKEELKEFVYSIGAEYSYANTIALRAGYFHEAETKGNRKFYTFGFGINYKMFIIDASYLAPSNGGRNNPLDNTFRFSLGFQIPK
ncbi:type IX secretion system outer membrane channel protein PorV [uncultured Acetobacteroides sp.]|uniref:type IX secretion system outer membrane channel protein PorV n=1 Tax=uncultured Acetobacteroides sp. TaxID=1760811 RepID=UPI0029F58C65|nr:type IX secretion system outer membrane channel protein PorV [uncultured Acetobacteroides sp.]